MTETQATEQPNAEGQPPLRIRYRVRFEKRDLLRWISHRDLARLWERLIRRAALELSMTEGFHPKPRVGFPSALALGVQSLDEVVELDLAEELSPAALFKRLDGDNQPGLVIKSVARLPDKFGKAKLLRSEYTFSFPSDVDMDVVNKNVQELLGQESATVQRKGKPLTVTVCEQILRLEVTDDSLQLTLAACPGASLRPTDVLDLIGAGDWVENGSLITRQQVVLEKEFAPEAKTMIALASDQPGAADESADCHRETNTTKPDPLRDISSASQSGPPQRGDS